MPVDGFDPVPTDSFEPILGVETRPEYLSGGQPFAAVYIENPNDRMMILLNERQLGGFIELCKQKLEVLITQRQTLEQKHRQK